MSTTTSRRNALALVATLPALAAPAAVAAMGSPDAELLELGVKLDAIISDWQAEARLYRDETNVWEAACEAAGLPRLDLDEVPREEFDARQKGALRTMVSRKGGARRPPGGQSR